MRLRLAAPLALALVLAAAGPASGYPQFQLSTGNSRCSQCHIAPGGGGLLNGYGRSESADAIALGGADSTLGDPRFLYGLVTLPRWLALGFEYRGAGLYKSLSGQDPYLVAFPMQDDLQAHVQVGSFSFAVTGGIRGGARTDDPVFAVERLVSREHYLMWRPNAGGGLYARVGRFFPVYGLRVADHTSYLRRRLGFHTLEEPYGLGGGLIRDRWEVHGSLFLPAPVWRGGAPARGAALYYERRLSDALAVGAQTKVTQVAGVDVGWLAGGTGKLWLPGTQVLLMGEVDAGVRKLDDGPGLGQLLVHAGATWFAHRGLLLTAAVERWHADLELEAGARDALTLQAQFFPRAHVELHLITRLEAEGNRYGSPGGHGMLMLHYWL